MKSRSIPSAPATLALHAAYAIAILSLVFSRPLFRADRFWAAMTAAVVSLNVLAWWADGRAARLLARDMRRHFGWKVLGGLAGAIGLYAVFIAGRWGVLHILPGGHADIAAVYELRAGRSVLAMTLALVVVGAGEEIFWRHHWQRCASARWGARAALWAQAGLYALAHVASRNATLMAAAGVAGLFWGALYAWRRSPWLNIVSHVVWDLLVFVLLPLAR